MASDMLCLTLQTIGGVLTSVATTFQAKESYINVMVAGLVLQVLSLLVFMAIFLEFVREIYVCRASEAPDFVETRESKRFQLFLFGMLPLLRPQSR